MSNELQLGAFGSGEAEDIQEAIQRSLGNPPTYTEPQTRIDQHAAWNQHAREPIQMAMPGPVAVAPIQVAMPDPMAAAPRAAAVQQNNIQNNDMLNRLTQGINTLNRNQEQYDSRREYDNAKERRLRLLGLDLLPYYSDDYKRQSMEEKVNELIKKELQKELTSTQKIPDSEMMKLVKTLIKKSVSKKKPKKNSKKKNSKKKNSKKKPKKNSKKKNSKKKPKKNSKKKNSKK
jgi:hypothetical protein